MKNFVKLLLQRTLGYNRYLRVFSKYKIRTLRRDQKERDFFAFMDAIIKEGDIMDVGANIGIMTYHLSKRFPTRKIIAIEPMPDNFSVLQAIVDKNRLENVDLKQVAVGDETTTIQMVLPVNGKVKMQGLAHVVHDSIAEWNEGEKLNVNCVRLDDLANGNPIAGIKMDIENFEFFALKGAEHILSVHQPVVYLELWANENRDKCFEFLRSLNYLPYVNIEDKLIPYDPATHQKQNFIFKTLG